MPKPRHALSSPIVMGTLSIAAALLAGCSSTPLPSIGSITGNKISDTDRVFLMAAGSWDSNHDNQVTCDEWRAYATELFNGADANRDDALEAGEWPRVVSVDRMFETANFGYYDKNGDGKVTRAEFVDAPNPAFRLMGAQTSCVLTGAQVAGARSKTEYDVTGGEQAPQSGDPREQKGTGADNIFRQ